MTGGTTELGDDVYLSERIGLVGDFHNTRALKLTAPSYREIIDFDIHRIVG